MEQTQHIVQAQILRFELAGEHYAFDVLKTREVLTVVKVTPLPNALAYLSGVVNLRGGRPTMQLTGGALARLQALTPEGCQARIDLSITDDWPLAQAFVIISAVHPGKS